ncbi:invasion-associated locus B family protein [Mesorhizobium plurifarium]|nr:invasion-associated locus B family protein [Mesorhizobium plurifarium]
MLGAPASFAEEARTPAAQSSAAPAAAFSEAAARRFDDWHHRCAGVTVAEGKTITQCEVVQVARVKQGEEEVNVLTLAFAKADPNKAGKKDAGGLMLTALVPLNVYLPAGFGVDADGKQVADLVYRNCNQAGCFAEKRLAPAAITALSKGANGAARLKLMNGQNVAITFSLKGLTAALVELDKPVAAE